MIQIAPSILSADFTKLGADLDAIATADMVHAGEIGEFCARGYNIMKVMDGAFVPNISYGMPICKAVNQYTDMFLDTHLMIEKPARYIEDFAKAGADLISVHLEADGPRGIEDALNEMERCGVKKAVALRPITSPKAILPYIDRLDMVLVMTVEPGFGGQSFMMDQLDVIRQCREIIDWYNPSCLLEVDGGINLKTAPLVKAAGANVLVAGSGIYGQTDRAAAIRALREA